MSVVIKNPLTVAASGGLEINGLIKEYQVFAGENISAGDFVEFINNDFTQLNSKSYSVDARSCCLLENNKVFIAHGYNNYLYGTIVEINGTEMTPTITQLNSTSRSMAGGSSCCLLEANKVFIAHGYGSDKYLYGTIVEINGTEMTPTTTQLDSTSNSCRIKPSCCLVDTNKIFIAQCYSENNYLYGTIVEINGTEMTPTITQLSSASYSCNRAPSCCLLENNKVFIAHSYSSSCYLYGTIVEINGTEMTPTITQLSSASYSCFNAPSCCLLENNKVFIAHPYTSNVYLYGTIVEINGTEMTATTTRLNSASNSCYTDPSCCLLEQNKVFIAHGYMTTLYLYGTIVEINGTEMTATTTRLNSASNSCYSYPICCLVEQNKVFIAHPYSSSNYLYGTIYSSKPFVKSFETLIQGVAKQSGAVGDTIQVYVPNEE